MTLWSSLYASPDLISRDYYKVPGTTSINAPEGTAFIRVSMVGAGGWTDGVSTIRGGGSAFARKKLAATAGQTFNVQVGDIAHSMNSGDSLGDSIVTRVSGSLVVARADRGKGTTTPNKGLASASVGDTVRDGENGSNAGPGTATGGSGGDDADPYPIGFGGASVQTGAGNLSTIWAAPGVGGLTGDFLTIDSVSRQTLPPGQGMVCVEFFNKDPGY